MPNNNKQQQSHSSRLPPPQQQHASRRRASFGAPSNHIIQMMASTTPKTGAKTVVPPAYFAAGLAMGHVDPRHQNVIKEAAVTLNTTSSSLNVDPGSPPRRAGSTPCISLHLTPSCSTTETSSAKAITDDIENKDAAVSPVTTGPTDAAPPGSFTSTTSTLVGEMERRNHQPSNKNDNTINDPSRNSTTSTIHPIDSDDADSEDDDEGLIMPHRPRRPITHQNPSRPTSIQLPPKPSPHHFISSHTSQSPGTISTTSSLATVCDDDLDLVNTSLILSPRASRSTFFQDTTPPPNQPPTPPQKQPSLVSSLLTLSASVAAYSVHTAISFIPSTTVRTTVQGILATTSTLLTTPPTPPQKRLPPPPQDSDRDFLASLRTTLKSKKFAGKVLSRNSTPLPSSVNLRTTPVLDSDRHDLLVQALGRRKWTGVVYEAGRRVELREVRVGEVLEEKKEEEEEEEARRMKRVPSAPARYGGLMHY